MANLIVEQRPEGRRVTITISTICEACIILERTIFSDWSRENASPHPGPKTERKPSETGFVRRRRRKERIWSLRESGNGMERVSSTKGQAEKGARGMPWHQEPTKDVTSCDKPRGGANIP